MASRLPSSWMRVQSANRALTNAPASLSRTARSTTPSSRAYSTGLPPTGRQPQTKVGAFYQSFGSPILKCFLGALFTYQVVYWGWMKLENMEEQKDKEDEIAEIKSELKALVVKKMEAERSLAEEKQGTGQTTGAEKSKTGAEKLKMGAEKSKKGWW